MLILLASLLWLLWGVFHILGGTSLLVALSSQNASIPKVVQLNMMGGQFPFYVLETLNEHAVNGIWFGLVVSLGAVFGFKQKSNAMYLCTIVGGFAQLAYTSFLVIPGKAPFMGVVFSCLVAIASTLGLIGVYLKKKEGHP